MALQPIDIKKAKHKLSTKGQVGRREQNKQQRRNQNSEELARLKRWLKWERENLNRW